MGPNGSFTHGSSGVSSTGKCWNCVLCRSLHFGRFFFSQSDDFEMTLRTRVTIQLLVVRMHPCRQLWFCHWSRASSNDGNYRPWPTRHRPTPVSLRACIDKNRNNGVRTAPAEGHQKRRIRKSARLYCLSPRSLPCLL